MTTLSLDQIKRSPVAEFLNIQSDATGSIKLNMNVKKQDDIKLSHAIHGLRFFTDNSILCDDEEFQSDMDDFILALEEFEIEGNPLFIFHPDSDTQQTIHRLRMKAQLIEDNFIIHHMQVCLWVVVREVFKPEEIEQAIGA